MIYHMLSLVTQGVVASFGINGVPIENVPTGGSLTTVTPLNPWLHPHINTLNILLSPPLAAAPADQPVITLTRAELYTVKAGSRTNDPDKMLVRFERGDDHSMPLPVVREMDFVVENPPPSRLWAEAEVVNELTDRDQAKLRSIIQEFARAITERNVEKLLGLLAYKTHDMALASGHNPAEMTQVIRSQYMEEMFAEKELRVEGGDTSETVAKLVGKNQLVWLPRRLTEPALEIITPNAIYSITIYAARIKGEWCIVR